MVTNHNPFLTSVVYQSCNQARVNYLDTLARLQMKGGTPLDQLRILKHHREVSLDQYRDVALYAAAADDISTASTQLAYIVLEWGFYKALDDLITTAGVYLDPSDPDMYNDFMQSVQSKIVFWSTELQNKRNEGETKRRNDLAANIAQRYGQLNDMHVQLVQEQRTSLDQAHQNIQRYASSSLKGVEQAQQGVQWMQQGVEAMHRQASQNVQWFQQGVQNMYTHGAQVMAESVKSQQHMATHLEQSLPEKMEQAQARTEHRRLATRGCVIVLLLLALPGALLIGYLILTRLVLH